MKFLFTVCICLFSRSSAQNPSLRIDLPETPFTHILEHPPQEGTRIVVDGTPRRGGQQFDIDLALWDPDENREYQGSEVLHNGDKSMSASYHIEATNGVLKGAMAIASTINNDRFLTREILGPDSHCFRPGEPFNVQIRFRTNDYGLFCGDREISSSKRFEFGREFDPETYVSVQLNFPMASLRQFTISGDVDIAQFRIYHPGDLDGQGQLTTVAPRLHPILNPVLQFRQLQAISLDLLQFREQLRDAISNQERLEQKLDQVLMNLDQGQQLVTEAPNVNIRREIDLPPDFSYRRLITVTGIATNSFTISFMMRDGRSAYTVVVDFGRRQVIRSESENPNNLPDETDGGFPFEINQPFTIKIRRANWLFFLEINGQRHSTHTYRTVDYMNKLVVEGGIRDLDISDRFVNDPIP